MSAARQIPEGLSEYFAEMGKRGGKAQNPRKGFGSMDEEKRKKAIAKAIKTRAANRKKRAKAKAEK